MKKIRIIFLYILSFVGLNLVAQPNEQMVQVLVTPNHTDLLYKEGESVVFAVSALKNGLPIKDVEVRYEVSEDMMQPHKSDKVKSKSGCIDIKAGSMNKPGFLRCRAFIRFGSREYQGVCTVGFAPQRIVPTTRQPDDFISFWNKAKAEASKVPLDVKITPLPERSNEKVRTYNVSFQNNEWGSRIYGVLCIPTQSRKHPAILKVPGAGVRGYSGDIESAQRGYIVLEIGIHGIPVNMPDEVYRSLYGGPLKNYHSFNLDNLNRYYYKRVFMGCVRAIDYIFTLPEFDGVNLLAYGGSQGGALSIITAGLDSRVKALVAFYPAMCDMAGYLHGRAGGWPHMFRLAENQDPEKERVASYYDVVNFARQVKVPGFYSFGYNDMICPPTTVYSAINSVNAPKKLLIVENTAHYAFPEQSSESWKWLADFLNNSLQK